MVGIQEKENKANISNDKGEKNSSVIENDINLPVTAEGLAIMSLMGDNKQTGVIMRSNVINRSAMTFSKVTRPTVLPLVSKIVDEGSGDQHCGKLMSLKTLRKGGFV